MLRSKYNSGSNKQSQFNPIQFIPRICQLIKDSQRFLFSIYIKTGRGEKFNGSVYNVYKHATVNRGAW